MGALLNNYLNSNLLFLEANFKQCKIIYSCKNLEFHQSLS